jgi:hypothetical protein
MRMSTMIWIMRLMVLSRAGLRSLSRPARDLSSRSSPSSSRRLATPHLLAGCLIYMSRSRLARPNRSKVGHGAGPGLAAGAPLAVVRGRSLMHHSGVRKHPGGQTCGQLAATSHSWLINLGIPWGHEALQAAKALVASVCTTCGETHRFSVGVSGGACSFGVSGRSEIQPLTDGSSSLIRCWSTGQTHADENCCHTKKREKRHGLA